MEIEDDRVDWELKKFGKQKIVGVFEKEVQIYKKQLDMKPSEIRKHIYLYLDQRLPVVTEEEEQVIEIFDQRVKFYSTEYPFLSEEVIKKVIKEYLVNEI